MKLWPIIFYVKSTVCVPLKITGSPYAETWAEMKFSVIPLIMLFEFNIFLEAFLYLVGF